MGSHTIFTLRNSDNIRIQNLDPKQQINIIVYNMYRYKNWKWTIGK